ncbi:DUF6660 family protein [Arsenicibacter rosenii]|uniref:DUF6660 family protein n=1 Tax=Arsenicibacter rosenii TaxID=1750698 RepID=UPI00116050E3|nr:DUF6660 family protein [Arsenicibacter rosenii]
MKPVFCLLMGLYLLTLSVLPCADGALHVKVNTGLPTQIMPDGHDHDQHQASGDLCSPLCTCACCGTVISPLVPFAFSFTPPVLPLNKVPELRGIFFSEVALSLWQPPKIS